MRAIYGLPFIPVNIIFINFIWGKTYTFVISGRTESVTLFLTQSRCS